MSVSGVKSRYDHLDVLLSLSVSHMDVYFPVSTKPPLPPVHLCLCLCLSINVCLCASVFLCVFPPLLPPVPLLSIFVSLSLTLAVSTFGENSTGAPLGKVLPLSSTFSSPNWYKLASRSFFLSCYDYSCSFTLGCLILNNQKQKPPQILKSQRLEFIELVTCWTLFIIAQQQTSVDFICFRGVFNFNLFSYCTSWRTNVKINLTATFGPRTKVIKSSAHHQNQRASIW